MSATLAIRLPNWLGDTVMAVPAVLALRRGMPDARLLLAGPWARIFAGQGLADVLVTSPRTWTGRLRTADVVRRFGPETAVLLPNSVESALTARYWGARRRIGFAAPGRALLLTDGVAPPTPRLHQIDEYLCLAERCGVTAVTREPRLEPPRDGAERAEARGLFADAAILARGGGRRVIGVHLGAEFGPAKLWPAARVVEFCRLLAAEDATPVLLGGPGDRPFAAAIAAEAPVASLVGRDRPELLPALLTEVDALVSGDTGVAHLAAALGTPVVALFGPTDPRLSAPRGPAAVLTRRTPCAPCFYRVCPIEHPCLAGIDARTVRERLGALMAVRAAGRSTAEASL
ncbi:MAG: glycosyltransferase family 9 protein [Candidatus Rokuibacteriota bacterium]